jgi:hypothetical protein
MTEMSKPKGSTPWYLASAVAVGVSVDTSWRFFEHKMHITDLHERALLFAVLEVALFAAGWSMRAGVRRDGHPGSARLIAWALCGMSAYMAYELSGPMEGLARVLLGPVLALVALHQALGIEIKARLGQRSGTWARIGREMRERVLSRLGLADDSRDALQRTRERAAERAAWLATHPERVWFKRARLARAVRRAQVATDATMKRTMLAHAAAYANLGLLMEIQPASPWTDEVPVPSVRPSRPASSPTSGGPAIGWDMDKVVRLVLEGRPDVDVLAAGVSSKNLQRVRRVVRALPAEDIASLVRGDMTLKFATAVQAAYLKAMTS